MAKSHAKVAKRPSRFDNLTDEEIQRRWNALTPIFIKSLTVGAIAAPSLFFLNRLIHPNQTVVNVLNVAFQVSCAYVVLFAFLTAMSLILGRPTARGPVAKK